MSVSSIDRFRWWLGFTGTPTESDIYYMKMENALVNGNEEKASVHLKKFIKLKVAKILNENGANT